VRKTSDNRLDTVLIARPRDRGDEAVTATGQRRDVSRAPLAIAQRLAQSGDVDPPAEEMFEAVNAGWMDLGVEGTEHVAGTTSARDVFAAAPEGRDGRDVHTMKMRSNMKVLVWVQRAEPDG
jgi:hypothetical protein